MSVTMNPAASSYTKHAAVSSANLAASLNEIEVELVAARNAGNQGVVHQALRALQQLADLMKRLHL